MKPLELTEDRTLEQMRADGDEPLAADVFIDPATRALVYQIEAATQGHGLARVQYALAGALWRAVTRHPSLAMTPDLYVSCLTLHDGGRRIELGATVFPPPHSAKAGA